MSNDLYFLEILAKEKQAMFRKEARERGLRRAARGKTRGFGNQGLVWFGELLIRAGEGIKQRFGDDPPVAQASCGLSRGGR